MTTPITRREFTRRSAATVAAAFAVTSCGGEDPEGAPGDSTSPADPLDILILGGTGFIGPHQVRTALDRGHTVTLFNRGQRAPDMFPGLETIIGDRANDLEGLRGRRWDAVIDNSATNPDWVRASAGLLADNVGRYLYVSSTGVFFPYLTRGVDETVEPALVVDSTKGGSSTYGVNKALSEDEAEAAFGDRAIVVRPHFIAGPGDSTDRFTSWPLRLSTRPEVVAPGTPEDPVQYIDVRDLTTWMIGLLEEQASGVFNAAGPAEPQGVGEMITRIASAVESTSEITWIPDLDFLDEHGFGGVPWVPPRGDLYGMASVDTSRAIRHGLRFRPVEETARDALAWYRSQPEDYRAEMRHGPTEAEEAELLGAWRARSGQA